MAGSEGRKKAVPAEAAARAREGERGTTEPVSVARNPGRPRKVPADEARERVLRAATLVFVEHGYDEASSDRIAELSGIPRPTIYRVVGSKQDVFVAAVERALQRIIQHQTASMANTTHLRGRDVASANVGAFLELVKKEPEAIRMLQLAESSGTGGTLSAARAIRQGIVDATSVYVQATWEGKVPLEQREADLGAKLTVAIVETGAAHFLSDEDFTMEEIVDFLTNFVRTGFTFLRSRE